MSEWPHSDGFDHTACWKGRFSRLGEATWPPCQEPAKWSNPRMPLFRWCDHHRHEGDLEIEENR